MRAYLMDPAKHLKIPIPCSANRSLHSRTQSVSEKRLRRCRQDLQARAMVSLHVIFIIITQRDKISSVYYRTYAEDGPIPSKNPVYSDDPNLGRILAKRVTPPHTVINLKKCLSNAEDIDKNITASLFVSASSQTPMDDSGHVSILAYPGPGCAPHEPMALIAMVSSPSVTAPPRAEANLLPSGEGIMPRYSKDYGRFTIAYCTDQLL